jgi:serine/threonine protein phosphatase PrpC
MSDRYRDDSPDMAADPDDTSAGVVRAGSDKATDEREDSSPPDDEEDEEEDDSDEPPESEEDDDEEDSEEPSASDDEEDSEEPPASDEEDDASDPPSSSGEPPSSGKKSSKSKENESSEPPPSAEPSAGKKDKLDIKANVFGRTDVGQIREHNEDNLLIADLTSTVRGIGGDTAEMKLGNGGVLLVVCDGMGGAAAGEVASQMATDVIYEKMLAAAGHFDRDQLALDVVEALEDAGTRILDEANNNRACRGMGTTATVAAFVDDVLLLGQVGDSRAYLLRGDRLVQVTRDQSLVNQLIEAGQLTEEEAENFEHSNIILQALGTADAVQVDLTFAEIRRGDVLMMCSDGLSGMMRDSEIRDTMVNVPEPTELCRVLIDDANQAGGHDNITVIVAVFDGEDLKEPDEKDAERLKYAKYELPAWVDDDHAGATQKTSPFDEEGYDDTPLIEITGEFEIDGDTSWDDLLDDRPLIPTDPGPNVSNYIIWVAVAVLVFALYYLVAR